MHTMLLWDVDTQVDFLSPTGRLYVPGSERIIPNLGRLTAWAASRHVPIVSSACAHQPGDQELETYGQHCMVGTLGQQKVQETLREKRFIVPNRRIELPDLKQFEQVIIEKQAFDFATNPNAAYVLEQLNPTKIALYGVVTEICVAAAARSLLSPGRKMFVVRDAVAELDADKAQAFLTEFVGRGGNLTSVEQVLASSDFIAA